MRRWFFLCLLALAFRMESQTVSLWKDTELHRHHVSLTPFLPQQAPRAAVIVCPGGSYSWHDMETEGFLVAQWLRQNDIAAFVLKYRVQGVPAYLTHSRLLFRGRQHPDMLEDVQRAIQWVRENDSLYGLSPSVPLGVMGFSAGGHLAMSSASYADTDFLAVHGIRHTASLCPDFVVPVYPVVSLSDECCHKRSRRALLGERRKRNLVMRDSLSLELHVPAHCPPVFLVNCKDDPVVNYRNSELLDSALTARNIPHRYIQYRTGGHGFGASEHKGTPECRQWKEAFLQWLNDLLTPRKH